MESDTGKPRFQVIEGGTDNVRQLHQSDKAFEQSEHLREAVVYDEKGMVETDAAGVPVFKDQIEWEATTSQLRAMWACCRGILEHKLAPPGEVDAIFDLMHRIAKVERPNAKSKYKVSFPVNYFVGAWHCIDTAVKTGIFKDAKDKKLHD